MLSKPINFVSWNQAVEFGTWVAARLPSESEWEFAGRDRGNTLHFPWEDIGFFATCDYAVLKGCDPNQYIPIPKPICSRPAGNTALGLCDILGNVSEWVQDRYYFDLSNTPNDGSAFSCDNSSSCTLIARGSNCDVSGVDFSQTAESSLPTLLDYNKNPLTDRGLPLQKDVHSFRVGFRLARTAN